MSSIRLNITDKNKTFPLVLKTETDNYTQILKFVKNKFKKGFSVFTLDGKEINNKSIFINDQTLLVSKDFNLNGLKKSTIEKNKPKANIQIIGEEFCSQEAINQLDILARKEGVINVLALPDLSLTTPCPVGTSVTTKDIIYPSWIGNDIGCGVTLFKIKNYNTNIFSKLKNNTSDFLKNENSFSFSFYDKTIFKEIDITKHNKNMGTIGGGNHFCEIQINQQGEHFLCVHSGSRSLGKEINSLFNSEPLKPDQKKFHDFIEYQNFGIQWAKNNRLTIAKRFCETTNLELCDMLTDICHNFIEKENGLWIHRKGSIPTNKGLALIPGSRGSNSYLVEPKGKLLSLPHGAGRRYSRNEAEKRKLGNKEENVICRDKSLFHQEAPSAYKNIDDIIKHLENFVNVVMVLKPLLTYKC